MKSAVVVFPGINRERDMARTLKLDSGREPAMVWHADTALPDGTDLVVVPGGFSYGDYLRCGAIAARAPIMGRGCVRMRRAAGSCSACATASRSCARRGCCRAC
jgi:phosphoribosylformylglycinamidine synthase